MQKFGQRCLDEDNLRALLIDTIAEFMRDKMNEGDFEEEKISISTS